MTVQPVATDDRLYTVIEVTWYAKPSDYGKDRPISRFGVGVFATEKQRNALKEFLLEDLRKEAVE